MVAQQPPKNPTLAAILSFLIAGVGQIYNGEVVKGIVIIVVQILNVVLMGIIIGFVTWPIVWIWSMYDAYKVAQRLNEQAAQQVVVATKTCPRCAERVNSGARVCHFCRYEFIPDVTPESVQPLTLSAAPVVAAAPITAAAQSAVKYCSQCGEQAAIAANFCLQCGTRFETAPVEPTVAPAVPSAEDTLPAAWLPESAWSDATQPNRAAASADMDVLSDAETASETPAYYDDSPMSAEVAGGLAGADALEELS